MVLIFVTVKQPLELLVNYLRQEKTKISHLNHLNTMERNYFKVSAISPWSKPQTAFSNAILKYLTPNKVEILLTKVPWQLLILHASCGKSVLEFVAVLMYCLWILVSIWMLNISNTDLRSIPSASTLLYNNCPLTWAGFLFHYPFQLIFVLEFFCSNQNKKTLQVKKFFADWVVTFFLLQMKQWHKLHNLPLESVKSNENHLLSFVEILIYKNHSLQDGKDTEHLTVWKAFNWRQRLQNNSVPTKSF